MQGRRGDFDPDPHQATRPPVSTYTQISFSVAAFKNIEVNEME
jgi:hypothetical protein